MADEAPLTDRERYLFKLLTRGAVVTVAYCFAMIVFGAPIWKTAVVAAAILVFFSLGMGRLKLELLAVPVFLIAAVEWLDFPVLKSLEHLIWIHLQNMAAG